MVDEDVVVDRLELINQYTKNVKICERSPKRNISTT